jgi:heme oxygenase (mycobilin-producing)
MTITRLNQFHAADGKALQLVNLLKTVITDLEVCEGLISAQLLQSAESPRDIVIVEVWESIKSHQDAAKTIAPERIRDVLVLLDAPAKGSYFSVAKEAHPARQMFDTLI